MQKIKTLLPSWPALVMGTGIVPIALNMGKSSIPFFSVLAFVFFYLSVFLFLLITTALFIKIFFFFQEWKADFSDPVSGAFLPTLPISFIVVSLEFVLFGSSLFGETAAVLIAKILFWAGTAGIFSMGLILTSVTFSDPSVNLSKSNFGWFIPPVSHLIIAVAGFELIHYTELPSMVHLLFVVSLFALGIGTMLYLFVGSNVYHRYLYHELPVSRLAPTLMIGMAPSAILSIIAIKMNGVLEHISWIQNPDGFHDFIAVFSIFNWGFSLWWFLLSLILMVKSHLKKDLNFSLSWWAFTFPVGALTVATGAVHKLFPASFFQVFTVILAFVLLSIWLIVSLQTFTRLKSGKIFESHS